MCVTVQQLPWPHKHGHQARVSSRCLHFYNEVKILVRGESLGWNLNSMAGRQCPSVRSYTLASYHKLDAYLTLPSTYFVITLFLKGNFRLLRLRNLLFCLWDDVLRHHRGKGSNSGIS